MPYNDDMLEVRLTIPTGGGEEVLRKPRATRPSGQAAAGPSCRVCMPPHSRHLTPGIQPRTLDEYSAC